MLFSDILQMLFQYWHYANRNCPTCLADWQHLRSNKDVCFSVQSIIRSLLHCGTAGVRYYGEILCVQSLKLRGLLLVLEIETIFNSSPKQFLASPRVSLFPKRDIFPIRVVQLRLWIQNVRTGNDLTVYIWVMRSKVKIQGQRWRFSHYQAKLLK